jgi:membrane protease YdiL (CAAX protease family)
MVLRVLRAHPVTVYLLSTFAVTWGAWIPMAATDRPVTIGFSPRYLLGLLGPLVGAVLTTAIVDGRRGVVDLLQRMARFRVRPRWWAVALGLPAGTLVAALALLAANGAPLPAWSDFGRFNGFPITGPLALWALLVLVNGFGEETGWRGFLLARLGTTRSPLRASLLVAAVWALWHVPAFRVTETYRQMDNLAIPGFFVGLMAGSLFLTWLYHRSRSSILVVALWHGTFNLTSGTVAARGSIAAVESVVVMVIAAVLLLLELRAGRRERRGRRANHVMAAGR